MKSISLYGLTPHEITTQLQLQKSYQGQQIYQWLIKGVTSFHAMSNLPFTLREELTKEFRSPLSSTVVEQQRDETGTVKLALRLADQAVVECVLLIDQNGRKTACLSSQVGCAMNCAFCRTATMGLVRNLKSYEIIEQFVHLKEVEENLTHIVMMGMGEPLANFTQVHAALTYLHEEDGFNIGYRRMTVSTCGVIKGINELIASQLPVRLALSLVSADNQLRSRLMPINKTYNLTQLKQVLLRYQQQQSKRITLEYVLLQGVNTDATAAAKLATFVEGLDVLVNVIPYNEVATLNWRTPEQQEIERFCRFLEQHKLNYTQRFSRGRGIDGACGQLAVPLQGALFQDSSDSTHSS